MGLDTIRIRFNLEVENGERLKLEFDKRLRGGGGGIC